MIRAKVEDGHVAIRLCDVRIASIHPRIIAILKSVHLQRVPIEPSRDIGRELKRVRIRVLYGQSTWAIGWDVKVN